MAKNLTLSLLLDFYGPLLTEKQRTVASLYYDEDLSLSEIAQAQQISRQGVRDALKRAEQQMLELEQTLGLAQRFRAITAGLDEIAETAQVLANAADPAVRIAAAQISQIAAELKTKETDE